MRKNLLWISLVLLVILLGAILFFQLFIDHEKPQMGEAEIRQMIKQRYAGTVTQMEKIKEQYQVRFKNQTGIYQIDISPVDGQVSNLVQVKRFDTPPQKDRQSQKIEHRRLTEEEAKKIALDQVKQGRVQEIELEEEAGILQYEIQIINANQQEMEVYLNAYTGEILSIVKNEEDD